MSGLPKPDREYVVTVCSACLRASCEQGAARCPNSDGTTTEMTARQLDIMGREDAAYYRPARLAEEGTPHG